MFIYVHIRIDPEDYKFATMAVFQENGRRGQMKGGFQGPVQHTPSPTLPFLNKTPVGQDSYAISRSFVQTSYDPSIPLASP